MPTIRPFFSPETIRSLSPARFRALVEPFRVFLSGCGIRLGQEHDEESTREKLAALLVEGGNEVPAELLTAVSLIDELATAAGMDALLAAAEKTGIAVDLQSDDTPADVAAAFWVQARPVAERVHADQAFRRQRSFVSFQTDRRPPLLSMLTSQALADLEADLGAGFEVRRRGRGCSVRAYQRPDGWWFLVRHGGPMRREECWEGGRVCYRPVQYDVLAYDPLLGELRINARTQGERLLYRQQIGKHLFGDENFFPGAEKYTLNPLIDEGPRALDAAGVEGIDSVSLGAVQIFWGGIKRGVETYRADDVFLYLAERGTALPTDRRWLMATFKVKLASASRPRLVTVRPANLASYARNEDCGLIERWLEHSGFVLPGARNHHAHSEPILECA